MLERKYGGDRARSAALTIQRAFRHYTLVKKFATITAMAKAEKRSSRRLVGLSEEGTSNGSAATSNRQVVDLTTQSPAPSPLMQPGIPLR